MPLIIAQPNRFSYQQMPAMFSNLTVYRLKSTAPFLSAQPATRAQLKHLSASCALMVGFVLLPCGLSAHATELPKTSTGLAQFAQSANKHTKTQQAVAPAVIETPKPRALPADSPLNQSAQGVDAISSMLGTQPLRTPQIKPYQPPVNLGQSAASAQKAPAALVTDPSRSNLERAVEKAFASNDRPELGGFKPVPEPMRAQPTPQITPRYQPAAPTQAPTQAQAPKPTPVVRAAKQATQTYQVVSGDSLSSLSSRSGVSMAQLAELNNLSPNAGLLRGQTLKFPKGSLPAASSKTEAKSSSPSSGSYAQGTKASSTDSYRVKPGDGLIAVAAQFGVSTAELAKLNNLSPTADLYVGQSLSIPAGAEPTPPKTYQVKRGDTLSGVATKFNLSLTELAEFNDIKTNSNLRVNQTLKLTSEDSKSPRAAQTSQSSTKASVIKSPTDYRVKSGDSLIQLARRFNVSTEELAQANGLSSRDQLQIGQSLKVPSLTKAYEVRRGDSLIALSKRFDISIEELAQMNELSPTAMLQIGQTLQVPAQ